jgi:hypothetical protein
VLVWLQRLLEKKVIFITGTDEHGEKIATSAEASGRNPKEHCDIISNSYKALWADVCRNTMHFSVYQYDVNLELMFLFQLCFFLSCSWTYSMTSLFARPILSMKLLLMTSILEY